MRSRVAADSLASSPRLIADAMLGRLARWLRILGLDVVYDPGLDDARLVERAVAEKRIILTRDRRLVLRKAARNHLLVDSDSLDQQLRQVLDELGVTPRSDRLFGRCLACNTLLVEIPAETARRLVPAHVARTQSRFRRCPDCRRVYWAATHVRRMLRRLSSLGLST